MINRKRSVEAPTTWEYEDVPGKPEKADFSHFEKNCSSPSTPGQTLQRISLQLYGLSQRRAGVFFVYQPENKISPHLSSFLFINQRS